MSDDLDIHWRDEYGNTRLSNAAWDGDVPRMRALLDRGAEPNRPSYLNHTPLAQAAYNGKADACSLLLERGANVEVGRAETGETPLLCAVVKDRIAAAKVLLDAGANPNATTLNGIASELHGYGTTCGETPLHHAARNGSSATIRLLLSYGADPNVRNARGEKAAQWTQVEECRSLLQPHGSDA